MSGFDKDRQKLDAEFDEVVDSVYPDELGSYVGRELSTAKRTPAYLCLLSARAGDVEPDPTEAAGLQMVHAGLDATRRVLGGEGWDDAGVEPIEEDMVLLAADVLVTIGFDRLLDHYEAATRLVNSFGENEGRALEDDDGFETSAAYYEEAYTTAVEVGCGGDPPPALVELAEALAVADLSEEYGREGRGATTHLWEEIRDEHGDYVDAVRNASAVEFTHDGTGAGTEVEAQD